MDGEVQRWWGKTSLRVILEQSREAEEVRQGDTRGATRQAALPRQSRDNMEPNTRKALSICKDDLI